MDTRTRLSLTTAVAILALAACSPTPSPKSPVRLKGRTFLLESSERADVLAGAAVRLTFTDEDFTVMASCNHIGGAYAIEQEHLVIGGMFHTEMGCNAQSHAQDDWLQAFFGSKPALVVDFVRSVLVDGELTYAIEAGTLELKSHGPRGLGANVAATN